MPADDGAGAGAGLPEGLGPPEWTYRWAARRRPFLHPVATPAGHVLTVDAPADHPWHHGLWFTIKFVNGENFWEEYDAYGVLRHDGPPAATGGDGDRYEVTGELDWIRPDRETVVLRERRTITHVPIDPDTYAIDLAIELRPVVDVELDRTPFTTWGGYGGLTFRGRPDLRDTRLLTGDGEEHDRVLGDRGPWLDLSGVVDGSPVGIALLDHPANPAHPVPWYASTRADTYQLPADHDDGDEGDGDEGDGDGGPADDWSNFVNAAFLWEGPRTVAAGEGLRFAYRVLVHDGAWDAGRVRREHERWTSG